MVEEKGYDFFEAVSGKMREQAVQLHHQRYQEVGFFSPNELDPYEPYSQYFVAQSIEEGRTVGVTRLILNKLEELPTMKYFSIYDIEKVKLQQLERHRYAEISAFTKMPQHDVALGLIRSVLHYSIENGLTHWICCLDERVYNYMHRMFRFPFRIVGTPTVYLGSKSIPCVLNLAECLSSLAEHRPNLFEYITKWKTTSQEVIRK